MRLDEVESPVCRHMEANLNAFLDGELSSVEVEKVVNHLEDCTRCQDYINHLKQFARVHKACFNPEDIFASMDGSAMFQNISRELVEEKIGKIAQLFYQIGKAFLAKGFSRKSQGMGPARAKGKARLTIGRRPVAIDKAKMKAGHLFREVNDLSRVGQVSNRRLKRAKSFFSSHHGSISDSLETGRRFIEESLAIDPNQASPRIYLGGFYYFRRNYKEAAEQFRKVLALKDVSEENRSEALINLGTIYSFEYRYRDAMACFKEVVKSGAIEKYPRFYRCLVFIGITAAKLGDFDQAVSFFDKTVKKFPMRIQEIRSEIWEMRSFQAVVENQNGFRKILEEKIPVLFAS